MRTKLERRTCTYEQNSREFDVAPGGEDGTARHDRKAEEHERGRHLLVPEVISGDDDEVGQTLEHRHLPYQKRTAKKRRRRNWGAELTVMLSQNKTAE